MREDRKSGIFAIKNVATGKMYIGKAVDLRSRKRHYWDALHRDMCKNKYLQEDYNMFGEEEFEFEVLEYGEYNELVERKKFWVDFYNTMDRENGYNLNYFRVVEGGV